MPRRFLGALAALTAALAPVAAWADPPAPVVVIEGRGFGHGVGMPQDGALALASAGASASAILSRFYPGTTMAKRSGAVRVGVYDAPGAVVVSLPGGGEVRDAPSGAQSPGFPITVNPGGTVSMTFEGGKYKATAVSGAALTPVPATPSTTTPAAAAGAPAVPAAGAPATPPTTSFLDPLLQALLPTTAPPTTSAAAAAEAAKASAGGAGGAANVALTARGLWAVPKGDTVVAVPSVGRSYRGTLIAGAGGKGMQLTDELDVEQYLRGMGEMPASWPAAALQAQAIAARTFAIRAASAGRTLCDDQQCQVYIGAGNEAATTSAAVAATKGQVLTYQGGLAETVYSASAGGISATPEEGFGPDSPSLPYLKPVEYQPADPQLWATSLPLAELGARFGYRGEVRDVRVSQVGPSGRPLEVTFDGESGPLPVDAHRFFSVLQLRSTLFTLRIEATPAVAGGEPLSTQNPEVPTAGLAGRRAIVAAELSPASLGRAPWVGLALLLLAVSATATRRINGPRTAPAVEVPPAEPLLVGDAGGGRDGEVRDAGRRGHRLRGRRGDRGDGEVGRDAGGAAGRGRRGGRRRVRG